MTIKVSKTWITLSLLMLLLSWMTGSVKALPPADEPTRQGQVGPAAVVSPLLQYQGRLTDPATGDPVLDGVYPISFRLYDVESGGTPLWTETEDVPVAGGLFSNVLGDGTPLDPTLFDGQALWLGIKVSADAEAAPRQPVLPVAYALSLVPGARVTGEIDGQAALRLTHVGEGNALLGISHSPNPDRTAIFGINYGGGHGVGGWTDSDVSVGVGGYNSGAGPGVRGESVGGAGGFFTSTHSYGVYGYSVNSNGVRGETGSGWAAVSGVNLGSGPGGYFASSSGPALYADGAAEVAGDLSVGGSVTGGDGTRLPIAYGFVNAGGDLASGSSNVSSSWDNGYGSARYVISIAGYSYYYPDYITTVTLSYGCGNRPCSVETASVDGNLLVFVYDSGGSQVQCAFQFVTYRP